LAEQIQNLLGGCEPELFRAGLICKTRVLIRLCKGYDWLVVALIVLSSKLQVLSRLMVGIGHHEPKGVDLCRAKICLVRCFCSIDELG
jgi:hypothetical protein